MVYLAYMQGPNVADKVKIMFEIWKSRQNLKHSTATTHKKNRSYSRECTLSCLKIFLEAPNSLWKPDVAFLIGTVDVCTHTTPQLTTDCQ
jgi:hypothetical protein